MNDIYREARRKVNKKKGFYRHLAVYISVAFFFFALNILTFREGREFWFFYPILPWGIGLLIHYLNTFGFPGSKALTDEWERKQMQDEVDRLRYRRGLPAADNETEDGLELKELEKRKKWRGEDLV